MIGTARERFDAKWRPAEGGCWLWTASVQVGGYGKFDHDLAHRVSYRLYRGTIPDAIISGTRTQSAIAADYGVSVPTISRIKRGRTWQHLDAEEGAR